MTDKTPSAGWRENGEPDPHGTRYECPRENLAMGGLTDDQLANGAFLNYDQPLNLQGILAGTHSSPISWMTAVKDRIRWLSRQLFASQQRNNEQAVEYNAMVDSFLARERKLQEALHRCVDVLPQLREGINSMDEFGDCEMELAELDVLIDDVNALLTSGANEETESKDD